MTNIHLSNGQILTTDKDYDKLVKKTLKSETIEVNGSTVFTKHILYLEK